MEKKYDHNEIESKQRNYFVKESIKVFQELSLNKVDSFVCLLPPPNITGKLHLGHMWNCTIQDILLRFNYLQGKSIDWLIGLDHAGISTQIKVEKYLSSQIDSFNPSNYSCEWMKEQGEKWFVQHKELIIKQWNEMGLLMDPSRLTYTLEPAFNKLVIHAFSKLYHDQLIYKGKKMVNWDVKLQTAISDLEVIHKTEKSKLYYLKYYLVEKKEEYLTVATSRPETAFADACLFVNPHDNRYTKYIGKEVINPVNQKKIPLLADESVLIDFGTGVLKCTPAHDFHDYELGLKYNLPCEVCLDTKGHLNELTGKYQGLDRFTGRKRLIHDLQENGTCSQIESYEASIGYSQRSDTIIEPYLSTQWFLNYREWIKKIEKNQKKNFEQLLSVMSFLPLDYKQRLLQWKDNLKDWCLSRQLWWGHQIPAWYHKKTGEICVAEFPPADIENWEQEKMVLDTWFSSGLAPIFYSDYLENKEKIKLPISLLVTAYDILFFWVFKMICFSYYFIDQLPPFASILIHGLIRDSRGKKMSKSLGNVIEPKELINKYGADATRISFVSSQTQDQDIKIREDKLKGNWRFLDKVWNIARYLESLKERYSIRNEEIVDFDNNNLSFKIETQYLEKDYLNCYFLIIFRNLVSYYDKFLDEKELKFSRAIDNLKKFVVCEVDEEEVKKWAKFGIESGGKEDDFGNDYLEILKLTDNKASVKIGLILFRYLLRLLHPFVPFLTSSLYDKLYAESLLFSEKDGVLLKNLVGSLDNKNLEKTGKSSVIRRNSAVMSLFYELLREVRKFKNKCSLEKENLIVCLILLPIKKVGDNKITYLTEDESYKEIDFADVKEKLNLWLKKLVKTELNYIFLPEKELNDDFGRLRQKLEKERSVICWKEELTLAKGYLEVFVSRKLFSQLEEIEKNDQQTENQKTKLWLEKEIARCEQFLNNKNFVNKAPKELVEKETEKLKKLRNYYNNLKSRPKF